jgi:steroid delta-isomerase-like uncharacterized protein
VPEAIAADVKQVVTRFLDEVWYGGSTTPIESLTSEGVQVRCPYTLARVRGKDSLAALVRHLSRAFPDGTAVLEHVIAQGETVAAEVSLTATQRGPLIGFPPRGRTLRSTQIWFFRVADGRIHDATVEFDLWRLLGQLGLFLNYGAAPAPVIWALATFSNIRRLIVGQSEFAPLRELPAPNTYAAAAPSGSVAQASQELVHRVFDEIFNGRNVEAADDIFSPHVVVDHPTLSEPLDNVEAFKTMARTVLTGYPDLRVSTEAMIGEDGLVATRWLMRGTQTGVYLQGLPPTGRRVTTPINEFVQVENGRIVRMTLAINLLRVAHQFGLIPVVAPRLAARAARLVSSYAPLSRRDW